jgi:hypothetical protein
MELGVWGDGEVCLAFWDSLHGDDHLFTLNEDGTIQEGDTVYDATELVKRLRALAKELDVRLPP